MAETFVTDTTATPGTTSSKVLTLLDTGSLELLANPNVGPVPSLAQAVQEAAINSFATLTAAVGDLISCPPVRDFPLPVFAANPVVIPLPPTAPLLDPLPTLATLVEPVFTQPPFAPQAFEGVTPVTPNFPVSPNAPALANIVPFPLDAQPVLGGTDPVINFPLAPEDFAGVIPADPL